MYQEVFGPDPAARDRSLAELRDKLGVLRPRQNGLVRLGVSPHAPYTVSDALYSAVAEYAAAESPPLPVAVHIAESEVERQLVERGEGVFAEGLRKRGIAVAARARSSIDLLNRTGVLRRRPLLIHSVRLDREDVGLVAGSGSPVAHCPVSNAKLGHGVSPVLELMEAGVTIALGTDSVASNNRMDMFAEARAAILAQRVRVARHDALCSRDALLFATLGGARALGIDSETGSLDVGKSADLAAFPLDAHTRPVHDPEAAAIFALPGTRASLVVVAGRELVCDGVLLRHDDALDKRIGGIERRMRDWALAN
jgi:5-methylthioadenosine/S-adenosylhomocysteine deaminase